MAGFWTISSMRVCSEPGQRSLVHAALAFLRGKDGVSRIALTAERGVLRLGPIALARF